VPVPGGFHATIASPGELRVYVGDRVLATLRQERLICREIDALWYGPLAQTLDRYVRRYQSEIRKGLGAHLYKSSGEWFKGADEEHKCSEDYSNELRDFWLGTLCRVLLRIQSYRHGGALLLVPTLPTADLSIKHQFRYNRIHEHLCAYARAMICQNYIEIRARQGQLDEIDYEGQATGKVGYFTTPDGRENVFTASDCGGYDENLFRSWFFTASRIDAMAALSGAVALVSSLSRVDGAVLMSGGLSVGGFGVEIRSKKEVGSLHLARDPGARSTIPTDPKTYGTRHRSMMRYCSSHPGSVGLVVSQDGDVRAITRVGRRVVMWDQLQLKAGMADQDLYPRFVVERLPQEQKERLK